MNIELERKRFQEYIFKHWKPEYHNFSIKEDGKYYYSAMNDAWNVWLGALTYDTARNG